MTVTIDLEQPGDEAAIEAVTRDAFSTAAYADGHEPLIPGRLREAGALGLSLVARDGEALVGHIAFSPVTLPTPGHWFGLGPVSVLSERQGGGIGTRLVEDGLARLRADGAAGVTVIGDPAFYGRFGFRPHAGLSYSEVPAPYVLALSFSDGEPTGVIGYHRAFDA